MMKKLLILTFLFTVIFTHAQNPVVSLTDYDHYTDYVENIYIKDIDGLFNPYIGTWQWSNGSDTLTVTFYKVAQVYIESGDDKYYRDDLVANYKYTQGNTTVVNTLNNIEPTISIMGFKPKGNIAKFWFDDPIKNKYGDIKTELISSLGASQLKFKLTNSEGGKLVLPGEPDFDWTFSIPHNIEFTLTKQ